MNCSSQNIETGVNDIAEEGEIRDEVNVEVGLAYDSVSSDSFSASNRSFPNDKLILSHESQSRNSFDNDKHKCDNIYKKSNRETSVKCKNDSMPGDRDKRLSNYFSDQRDKSLIKISETVPKNPIVLPHRSKPVTVLSEFNSLKSSDLVIDGTRQSRVSDSSRRGSVLDKNNIGRLRSKSSEKDTARKGVKRKKHLSRCSSEYHTYDNSTSRKKSKQEKKCKYRKDKVHKHHLQSDSDSDIYEMNSNRRTSHSHRTKAIDPTCRSFLMDSIQKKLSAKVLEPQEISSEKLKRFKNNVLMRKLLESGTIRSRRDSGGSDLNCEIGSVATISSPDFDFYEDIDVSEGNSFHSNETLKNNYETSNQVEISDDSEIEVIIPEKKQPELIDLKSDSDSEIKKHDGVPLNSESLTPINHPVNQSCQSSLKQNLMTIEQSETCEFVSWESPPRVNEIDGKETSEDGHQVVTENNLEISNASRCSEKENEVNIFKTFDERENKEFSVTTTNKKDDDEEDDLQLRLDALRSAVLKKHRERLKKLKVMKTNSCVDGKDSAKQISNKSVDNFENDREEIIENLLENKTVSTQDDEYYVNKRLSSPYSPSSSYSLSLHCENDNIVEEQDMEIAATDDETCVQLDENELNVPVSTYPESHKESLPVSGPEFLKNFELDNSSKILATHFHSFENTSDSVEPTVNNHFNEIPPQPLPPGVELSNLPPEFSHSLGVSRETIRQPDLANNGEPLLKNKTGSVNKESYLPSFGNELLISDFNDGYLDASPVMKMTDQSLVVAEKSNKDYFSDGLSFDSNYERIDIQTQILNNPPINDLSRDLKDTFNNHSMKPVEENTNVNLDGHVKENKVNDSEDSHQDYGNYVNLSKSSFHYQNSKLENEKLQTEIEDSYLKEKNGKTISTQNNAMVIKPATVISEKSQDSFQDEDDENVLRANLLTALGNVRVKSRSNENLATKQDKVRMYRSRLFKRKKKLNFRKRLVIGRPLKQNISSSLSDNGSVPYNFQRKNCNESLQITLPVSENVSNNLHTSLINKRKVIPTIPLKNLNNKFIIKVGEDSDSAEEHVYLDQKKINTNSDGEDWLRRVSIRDNTVQVTSPVLKKVSDNCPPELEKSVDLLVKQVRQQHELKSKVDDKLLKKGGHKIVPKTFFNSNHLSAGKKNEPREKPDSLTPLAVRHLPKSQQEEYRRLKQQILEKERLKLSRLNEKQSLNSLPVVNNETNQAIQQRLIRTEVTSVEDECLKLRNSVSVNSENVCSRCNQKFVPFCHSENIKSRAMLTEIETSLVNERYTVLDNILEVDLLLRTYGQQLKSYDSASKEVLRLREKLAEAELDLENCGKELDLAKKEYYISHEKLNNNSLKCFQTEKSCNKLGNKIFGVDYKLPKVAAELMTNKYNEVLKMSRKYLTSSDLEKIIDYLPPLTENSNLDVSENNSLLNVLNSKSNLQTTGMNQSSKKYPKPVTKTVDEITPSTSSDKTFENQLLPYVSPLTHLHAGNSRRSKSAERSNLDAILCPYDLRGSCMDDACPYQH